MPGKDGKMPNSKIMDDQLVELQVELLGLLGTASPVASVALLRVSHDEATININPS